MTHRRSLSSHERLRLFWRHQGICHFCDGKINGACEAWDISHEIPLELGGADDDENRKPAHRKCHRDHTAVHDLPRIAKAKRVERRHIGAKAKSSRPMPGSRTSPWKKTFSHGWVRR